LIKNNNNYTIATLSSLLRQLPRVILLLPKIYWLLFSIIILKLGTRFLKFRRNTFRR